MVKHDIGNKIFRISFLFEYPLHHKFGLIWCSNLNHICVKKRLDENDHVHKTTHEQKRYTQNGKRIFSHQNSGRRVNTKIFVHRKIWRGSHAMVSISIPDTPLLNYFITRFNTHTNPLLPFFWQKPFTKRSFFWDT